MNIGINVQKAEILLQTRRFKDAEIELRMNVLSYNPKNAYGHALLALALDAQGKRVEAIQAVQVGINIAPNFAYAHFVLARIRSRARHYDAALDSIGTALRLDPIDPRYHSLLAGIYLDQRQWREALDAAERALQLDPRHVHASLQRAAALEQLGLKGEARQTLDNALTLDPQNASTFYQRGWLHIDNHKYDEALNDFREALRLNPNLEQAKAGVMEALQARHFLYRLMRRYYDGMSSLGIKSYQFSIVSFILLQLFARSIQNDPDWQPFIPVLIVAWLTFVLLSWTSPILFDLTLRLNRYGRMVLPQNRLIASNWVGLSLLVAVGFLAAGLLIGGPSQQRLLETAGKFTFMIIPIAGAFYAKSPDIRKWLGVYTLALLGVILWGLWVGLNNPEDGLPTLVFIIGLIAYTWVLTFIGNKQ